uniref:GRIP domain-containing protein n=1 Tax=Acrobeloides nanus TaxID=290746 RepID=A0A914E1V3_9BILA
AYRNEALIWRTKAAQLEIVVKDQLLKASSRESEIFNELEQKKLDNERLRDVIKMLQGDITIDQAQHVHRTSIDEATETEMTLLLNVECNLPGCIDRKRALIDENKLLLEKIDWAVNWQIDNLNETIKEVEHKNESIQKAFDKNVQEVETIKDENDDLRRLADERLAECHAAQLSCNRLQQENDMIKQAFNYLENKCQVYQHTLLDHHLVVTDESTRDWQHAFRDPRYMINHSKCVQTDLTSEALSANEDQFTSLHQKLKEVEKEFSTQQADMHEKFAEIEENLFLKTKLVESLSRQLEIAAKEAQAEVVRHQKEREIYQKRIDKLGKVAGRVPLLETEIERLREEKSQTELQFRELQEEYEQSLEESLNESMKRYQRHSQYWQEKVNSVQDAKHRLEAELMQLKNKYDQVFLQKQLERTDLEQKLTSSIDHVTLLFNQINTPRRDVQVDARPKQASKYVSCKPNSRHKETEILKGELFNECEERLKICQGELLATRRQVEVLQQKLLELFDSQERNHLSDEHYSTPVEHTPVRGEHETSSSKLSFAEIGETFSPHSGNPQDRITQLERRNATLSHKLQQVEHEKTEISRQEKEKIQSLISEFESLRTELDQELIKYEEEKQLMKDYIIRLESQFWDSDQLKKKISQVSELDSQILQSTSLASDSDTEHAGALLRSASYPAISTMFMDSTSVSNVSSDNETTHNPTSYASRRAQKNQEVGIAPWPVVDEEVRKKLKHVKMIRPAFLKSSEDQQQSQNPSKRKFSHNLVSDLDKVQLELEKLLENVSSGLSKEQTTASNDSIYVEALTSLEEMQNIGGDNREILKQNKLLQDQLRLVTEELEDASRELELFRSEPRQDALEHQRNMRFPKSRSAVQLDAASADPMELQKWKEKAGVCFREINRLRRDLAGSEKERTALKTKLAMLRGEMILSRCQLKVYQEKEKKRKQDAKRRFSLVSKKSFKSIDSSNRVRSARESSISSYATANFSIASFHITPAVSEPNLHEEKKSEIDHLPSSGQEKPHGSLDSLLKESNAEKELEIVREAFRKQAALLKEKYRNLQDSKTKLEQKLELQSEALAQVREKNKSLEIELNQRDDKIKSFDESLKNTSTKNIKEKKEVEDRLSFVQRENSMYERKIREIEAESRNTYLVMFRKGQQAAQQGVVEERNVDPTTEDRIVLRFLHDAFYYYLLKKGDSSEHLQAIMTMLNFTSEQKDEVYRIFGQDKV